jgi:hypothetical protein
LREGRFIWLPLGQACQHTIPRERSRHDRAIVRLGHALARARPQAMGHIVGPWDFCPTIVDPTFRHGPLRRSVRVTKTAHTFVEMSRDGESWWKNVDMPHNVE